MPAELQFRLTGGAANTNPNASLGGVSSANQLSATAMNNLFDNVTPAEAAAGDVEYRAIDLYNVGDATAVVVEVFVSADTTSPATEIDLGLPASPLGNTATIADESAAPAGVTFAHHTAASRLAVPDIPAGQYARVWVRRTVTAGAGNLGSDQGTIRVEYA